jgi:ABC-type lipoprotein release transport system permease subunit
MAFKSKKALWQPVPIIVTIIPLKEIADSQLIVYLPINYQAKFKGLSLYPIQGFWLNNIMAVDDLDHALKNHDPSLMTITWKKTYSTIFDALLSEKRLISVVLSLLIILIYIQLALTLILVFKDKEKDMIALYFFKGGTESIYNIFYLYGALNVILGVVLGCAGGYIVSKGLPIIVTFLENLFHFNILPYQQYFVRVFPSEFLWSDLIISGGVSLVAGLVTTHLIVKHVSKKKMEQLLRQYQ